MIAQGANAPIWLDVRVLDYIEVRRENAPHRVESEPDGEPRCVVLGCGDLEVGLFIADGPEAATEIVRATASLTREGTSSGRPEGTLPAPPASELPDDFGRLIILSSLDPDDAASYDPLAGTEFGLPRPAMTIGRTNDNDVVIRHHSISRTHAQITRHRETGDYTIADQHSSNEVRVNGKVHASVELHGGDIVDLGHVRMRFVGPGRRLLAPPDARDPTDFLFVGADVVLKRDETIQIGIAAFRTSEVREYALRGTNLPLPGGHVLQAAMALLVVAAAERQEEEARPGWLGMRLGPRLRVRDIAAGSAADKAGVRVGDEWVSFAVSSASLRQANEPSPAAAHLALRVQRSGSIVEIDVALGSDDLTLECLALVDHEAPPFTASRLDGSLLSLGDLTGHVVVLSFFQASSDECGPAVPQLSRLPERYPELRVVGVNVEDHIEIEHALASTPTGYSFVRDDDGAIARSYAVTAPPMIVIIDKNSVVRRVELGDGDFDALQADLVQLMR